MSQKKPQILSSSTSLPEAPANKLLDVMKALRNPDGGCAWDIEQTFETIAPYTIEEAYEVADAIIEKDMDALKDELGDLLLQVVFHAQMASEQGLFDFQDVAEHAANKMISRHPHVFDDAIAQSAGDVDEIWEIQKDKETKRQQQDSVLDDVPTNLSPLKRSQKLQKRAARVGFEWTKPIDVLDKFEEETQEMREALQGGNKAEVLDEMGDLYFVLTNFSRMLGQDAEYALIGANKKFERRFRGIENAAKELGRSLNDMTLDEMETLWQEQKNLEKS